MEGLTCYLGEGEQSEVGVADQGQQGKIDV